MAGAKTRNQACEHVQWANIYRTYLGSSLGLEMMGCICVSFIVNVCKAQILATRTLRVSFPPFQMDTASPSNTTWPPRATETPKAHTLARYDRAVNLHSSESPRWQLWTLANATRTVEVSDARHMADDCQILPSFFILLPDLQASSVGRTNIAGNNQSLDLSFPHDSLWRVEYRSSV